MASFHNDWLNAEPFDDLDGVFFGNFVFKFVASQLTGLTFERYVALISKNADTRTHERSAAEIALLYKHRLTTALSPGIVANEEFSFDLNCHDFLQTIRMR